MLRLAFLTLLLVGCGEDDLRLDFTIPDQALEPLDLSGGLPDLAEHNFGDGSASTACVLDTDCMELVDNCMTCHCIALTNTAQIPPCQPQDTVDCTNQNPCMGSTVKCVSKTCVLQ